MPSVHRLRRRIGVELMPWGVAEARMIQRLLNLQPRDKLLEVGCSSGYRIEGYAARGVKLWGADIDHDAILSAKNRGTPVKLVLADACDLPYPDSFFDKVLCVHLLEHLTNPRNALSQMARVLKPGGKAVVVVPCERIRGDTTFAGWIRFRNLHLHRFSSCQITSILSPHFTIEEALFHTLIPGRFVRFSKIPHGRNPLIYYLSLAMLFRLKKSG